MKVVHLSYTDRYTGAGRAAYRIHHSLNQLNVDSTMLVASKNSSDSTVNAVFKTTMQKLRIKAYSFLNQFLLSQLYDRDPNITFSPLYLAYSKIHECGEIKQADIVSLYWVAGGLLQLESLARFNKPTVWRLSDMWPFTGGCNYAWDCEKFTQECSACPILRSKRKRDVSNSMWKKKKSIYNKLDLTITTPSHWMADLVKKSTLLGQFPVHVIHTGTDINTFRPLDRAVSRNILNFPQDRPLILFSTNTPKTDTRKGYSYFRDAVNYLSEQESLSNAMIVVVGTDSNLLLDDIRAPAMSLDKFNDDISLALLLSAVDVIVLPSKQDNLPNMALEAMACGCPVVSFDIGGMKDLVRHQENGYLAKPYEVVDLAEGIKWVLANSSNSANMRLKARHTIEASFTLEKQALAYKNLYQTILERSEC